VTHFHTVLQCVAVCCRVLQCVAVCCSVLQWWCSSELQYTTVRWSVWWDVAAIVGVALCFSAVTCLCCSGYVVVLQCAAVSWILLQFVAVCCSVLLCAEVCGTVLQCVAVCCSVLQCVAVWCSALQCVAVRCSVLQRVAVCCSIWVYLIYSWQDKHTRMSRVIHINELWHIFDLLVTAQTYTLCVEYRYLPVWGSVLQYVAVRCSALQCVTVCCSALQCVVMSAHIVFLVDQMNTCSMRCNPERHDACVCNVCVCSFDLQVTQWQHKHTHLFDLLVTAQTHDTLQHTATHCNTLQHTSDSTHTHIARLPKWTRRAHICDTTHSYMTRIMRVNDVTRHYSALQCVAVYFSVL